MEINVTFNTQMNEIFTSGGYNSRHVLRAPPNRGSSLLNITRAAADAHFPMWPGCWLQVPFKICPFNHSTAGPRVPRVPISRNGD